MDAFKAGTGGWKRWRWRGVALLGAALVAALAAKGSGKPQPAPITPPAVTQPSVPNTPGPPPSAPDELRTAVPSPPQPAPAAVPAPAILPAGVPVAPAPDVTNIPPPTAPPVGPSLGGMPAVPPAPSFEVPPLPTKPLLTNGGAPPAPSFEVPPLPTPQFAPGHTKGNPVVPIGWSSEIPTSPKPAAPREPEQPEITEPDVSIHRFKGKYLGGDQQRMLLYVETGAGKAEVQNRPAKYGFAGNYEKADVKWTVVPAGKVAWHEGRAFIASARELNAIGADGALDWRFVLPGRDDNGETLLGVAGFRDGKLIVASRQEAKGGVAAEGRYYTLDVASGRQVAFVTLADGFEPDTRFAFDHRSQTVVAVGTRSVLLCSYTGKTLLCKDEGVARGGQFAVEGGYLFRTAHDGVGVGDDQNFEVHVPGVTGTAPAGHILLDGSPRVFFPIRAKGKDEYALAAFTVTLGSGRIDQWQIPVKQPITAAPVVRGRSVYFVAGNVVYRVNAVTGAICWRHTLPLDPGDAFTDLAFVGGELRASGPGLLVRIAERSETQPVSAGTPDPVLPGVPSLPPAESVVPAGGR